MKIHKILNNNVVVVMDAACAGHWALCLFQRRSTCWKRSTIFALKREHSGCGIAKPLPLAEQCR